MAIPNEGEFVGSTRFDTMAQPTMKAPGRCVFPGSDLSDLEIAIFPCANST